MARNGDNIIHNKNFLKETAQMVRKSENNTDREMVKDYSRMEAERDKIRRTPQMEATYRLRNEGTKPQTRRLRE